MEELKNPKRAIRRLVRHKADSEKVLEQYLRRLCGERGWPCLKYSNSNDIGYPDRIIVLPESEVVWVELKSKGQKPTSIQQERHRQLRGMRHEVVVADSREAIDNLMRDLMRNLGIAYGEYL